MKNNRSIGATTTTMTVHSGFPHYRTQMFCGFAIMTVLYCICIATFGSVRQVLQLPPSAAEYCQPHQQIFADGTNTILCWRADLFAFEVVSGLALMWCAYKGFVAWHVTRIQDSIPNTPEGRLFAYIEEGHVLTAVSTTFQLFDLGVSFLIPEQRQILFLCHHIMAATVSWYGLNNQVSSRNNNHRLGTPSCLLCQFRFSLTSFESTYFVTQSSTPCVLSVLSLLWR
jgi:hypothetical protein